MGAVNLPLNLLQLGFGGQGGTSTVDGHYIVLKQGDLLIVLCHLHFLVLPLLASGGFVPALLFLL